MNQLLHFRRRNRIERRRRFIHQQYRRRDSHRTGDTKTLLLSAGQCISRFLQLIFHLIPKSRSFQCFLHTLANESIIFYSVHTKSVSHILEYAFRERIGTLEHHSHILAEFVHFHAFRIDIMSVDTDFSLQTGSRNQIIHPIEKPEKSRFATTGRSDKSNNRFFLNLHADALQCMKVPIPEVHITRIYFHCIHILI